MSSPIRVRSLLQRLIEPLQRILSVALPDRLEDSLRDKRARAGLVALVDRLLLAEQPMARAIPKPVRHRVIRHQIELVLDLLLLDEPAQDTARPPLLAFFEQVRSDDLAKAIGAKPPSDRPQSRFRIEDGRRLTAIEGVGAPTVRQIPSPNVSQEPPLVAQYLVMHYTAGASAESSIDWLCRPEARASAHLVIGRDGEVTQLVDFDRVAWHAGESEWDGHRRLNRLSIGIELDNAGKLERSGGVWRAWFGGAVPDIEVVVARHRDESEPAGWHAFTPVQLHVAAEIASLLAKEFSVAAVLGHDEISPGRRLDPGPAFPMADFRARVLGRADGEHLITSAHASPAPDPLFLRDWETITELNIREGPGARFPILTGSPLPAGTIVEALDRAASWARVRIVEAEHSRVRDLEGWVHTGYLRAIPRAVITSSAHGAEARFYVRGKLSTFGGPDDQGVSPSEGLALIMPTNWQTFPELFLAHQPPGTSGLARRLNPRAHYVACRWNYRILPKHELVTLTARVRNPRTGKEAAARPVDWGPHPSTGRVADLSPGLADFLEVGTDEEIEVSVA